MLVYTLIEAGDCWARVVEQSADRDVILAAAAPYYADSGHQEERISEFRRRIGAIAGPGDYDMPRICEYDFMVVVRNVDLPTRHPLA